MAIEKLVVSSRAGAYSVTSQLAHGLAVTYSLNGHASRQHDGTAMWKELWIVYRFMPYMTLLAYELDCLCATRNALSSL